MALAMLCIGKPTRLREGAKTAWLAANARLPMGPSPLRKSLVAVLSLLTVGVFAKSASADQLSYTLSAPLKQPNCAGDVDGDCLNDAMENDLAWVASPQYFLDDEESCASASYLNNGPKDGYCGRVDLTQVRPVGSALDVAHPIVVTGTVSIKGNPFPAPPRAYPNYVFTDIKDWAPNSGHIYTIRIIYVFGHFYDPHSNHLGDNENVEYTLSSSDLQTWTLVNSVYWAHGVDNWFTGDYLAARAHEIGSLYASVAADRDGHGSWPGRVGDSNDCAGPEDDCSFPACFFTERYCFYDATMKQSFANGHWEYMDTSRNIGEPFDGQWNANVVTVNHSLNADFSGASAGSDVASLTLDFAWGRRTEYMSSFPPNDKFCGWTCTIRGPGGDCVAPGSTECSSTMDSKWSKNCLRVNEVEHGCPTH